MCQCSVMGSSSDGAYSPTLCVLKIIMLKHKMKMLMEVPSEIGIVVENRNIAPEASLVVVAVIMNNPHGRRTTSKGKGSSKD